MIPKNTPDIISSANQDNKSIDSTEKILPPIDINSLDEPTTIAERPPIDLLAVEEEFSRKMNNFVPATTHTPLEIEKLYEENKTESKDETNKDKGIKETLAQLDKEFETKENK